MGSQDSNSKRKDSQDVSVGRKRSIQDININLKRESQESKQGSQSRMAIEESPEHESEDPREPVTNDDEPKETKETKSKRVRFFSISLKQNPKSETNKTRNGTSPIQKKTATVVVLAAEVEQNDGVDEHQTEKDERHEAEAPEVETETATVFSIPITYV